MYEKYVEIRDSRKLTDYRVSEDTGITKSRIKRRIRIQIIKRRG